MVESGDRMDILFSIFIVFLFMIEFLLGIVITASIIKFTNKIKEIDSSIKTITETMEEVKENIKKEQSKENAKNNSKEVLDEWLNGGDENE